MSDILASNGLTALTAADFEVVNLTPVVTGLSASSGAANSTILVNGLNFSGAAGQISVLFGNVASNSVTVLSDTQLSVLVPSGIGTVDVTVQSGVNEADNNSDPGLSTCLVVDPAPRPPARWTDLRLPAACNGTTGPAR